MLQEKTIEDFETSLLGELIHRDNGKYEETRSLYNGMINKRPLLIVQCANVADVISAVRFGRKNDLLLPFGVADITDPDWEAAMTVLS